MCRSRGVSRTCRRRRQLQPRLTCRRSCRRARSSISRRWAAVSAGGPGSSRTRAACPRWTSFRARVRRPPTRARPSLSRGTPIAPPSRRPYCPRATATSLCSRRRRATSSTRSRSRAPHSSPPSSRFCLRATRRHASLYVSASQREQLLLAFLSNLIVQTSILCTRTYCTVR